MKEIEVKPHWIMPSVAEILARPRSPDDPKRGVHTIVKDKSITCGFGVCLLPNTDGWACWLQLHPRKCIFHKGNRSIKHLIPPEF